MEATSRLDDVTRGLREAASDVEGTLRDLSDSAKSGSARSRFEQRMHNVKSKLGEWRHDVDENFERAKDATKDYVVKKPFQSLAIAGVVGLVVGLLVSRK